MKPIIAIEGLDGTGKTDVCPILAKELNALVYVTPPKEYAEKRNLVDIKSNDEDHYKFYREAVYYASDEIKLLAESNILVLDRYWLTTVVYHLAMGVEVNISDFDKIIKPNITIYLTVDPEVQIKRMTNRGLTAGDQRILNRMRLVAKYYENILPSVPNLFRIDTTPLNQEEVAQKIKSTITPMIT